MPSNPRLCAYCGKAPRDPALGAFCSPGCRDRDLLQWLGEGYRVPIASEDEPALDNRPDDGLNAALREG